MSSRTLSCFTYLYLLSDGGRTEAPDLQRISRQTRQIPHKGRDEQFPAHVSKHVRWQLSSEDRRDIDHKTRFSADPLQQPEIFAPNRGRRQGGPPQGFIEEVHRYGRGPFVHIVKQITMYNADACVTPEPTRGMSVDDVVELDTDEPSKR